MNSKVIFEAEMFSDNGRIIVETNYFGETMVFLVDTGGIKNHLYWQTHKKLAEQDGEKPEAFITMDNTEISFDISGYTILPEMCLSPLNENDTSDYNRGHHGTLCPQSFLEDGYIIYDFRNSVLTGLSGSEKDVKNLYPKLKFNSISFKYETEHKFPVIYASTASKPDIKLPYLIDTGAATTVIPNNAINPKKITDQTRTIIFADNSEVTHKVAKNVQMNIATIKSQSFSVDTYQGEHPRFKENILANGKTLKGLLSTEVFIGKVLAIPVRDDLPILLSH